MKTLRQYFNEGKREYTYTIKLAIPAITDENLDAIEMALGKYDLVYASKFRSTPIQESPLDFPNITNMPVYIADIKIKYPASLDQLRTMLGNTLGVSQQAIAVYSENDPRQIETDLFNKRNADQDYTPVLGNLEPETEHVPYGDEYNMSFLKSLVGARRLVKEVDSPINPGKIESEVHGDNDTFNDESNFAKDTLGFFGRVKKEEFKRK